MKIKLIATFLIVAAALPLMGADLSSSVEAKVVQLDPRPDMFTFRGPVPIEYQLTVKNPLTDRSITLKRIMLRTQGGGAYSLRADDPITFTVNADSSATINLSAAGRSTGGFLRRDDPVYLQVQLWFDQEGGKSFTKQSWSTCRKCSAGGPMKPADSYSLFFHGFNRDRG